MTKEELTKEEFLVKGIGIKPLLFNKFLGMEGEFPAEQRLHLVGKKVIIPADMIYSFLFQEKPGGCCQRFEGKAYKRIAKTGWAILAVNPESIPITHEGKEITFDKFNKNGIDEKAGMRIFESTVSQPKPILTKRPLIDLPWEIEFKITLYKNNFITKEKLYNWLVVGGFQVGIGSYRPRFGQFAIEKFEPIK